MIRVKNFIVSITASLCLSASVHQAVMPLSSQQVSLVGEKLFKYGAASIAASVGVTIFFGWLQRKLYPETWGSGYVMEGPVGVALLTGGCAAIVAGTVCIVASLGAKECGFLSFDGMAATAGVALPITAGFVAGNSKTCSTVD